MYRKATYKDIVILLRTTSGKAPVYEKKLSDLSIPVFCDTSSEYLDSLEIQTIISVLKVLDNPLQDIPVVSVLRSYIGGFTDNELIKIRLLNKNSYFYNALKLAKNEEEIKAKVNRIFNFFEKWKKEQEYLSLEELIWNIYMDTGYYQYVSLMPDGNLRIANLKMLLERAKQYEKSSFKGLFNFISFIDKLKKSSGDLDAAKIIGENENVVRIMSIHKSKGLEFPIVFLSGMGKKFNMQDLNDKLLLHHEIGLGPKFIDVEKGIEYNTLAKEAIRIKARKEAIAEEMRILYVALTRSREKLIMTGIEKNYNKSMEDKKAIIQMNNEVNENVLEKYISYLDWLEIISIGKRKQLESLIDIYVVDKNNIMQAKTENDENIACFLDNFESQQGYRDEIQTLLKWKYSYIPSTKIPSKTSVTQIKSHNIEEKKFEIPVPLYLKETDKLSNSQKGTIMHLVLQKLNLKKEYEKEEIKEFLEKLVVNKILTKNESGSVSISKIEKFLKGNLALRIKKAKEIYKETPFYMNLTSEDAGLEKTDENILVQGIIDLYFIDENDKLVLVDYKTDYVEPNKENELINKYKQQLELYKKAIKQATKREVNETYIYSVYLEKEVEIV